MIRRLPGRWNLGPTLVLLLGCWAGPLWALPQAVTGDAPFWETLGREVASCLAPFQPGIRACNIGLELREGERVVGTGSLKLARDGRASFILSTNEASCRFFSDGATATCLLTTPGDQVRFDTASDGACPFPVVRISKHPEQGFQLDFMLNLGRISASTPVDLAVHPETAGYICGKIRDRFPFAEVGNDRLRFYHAATAPWKLELLRESGKITGFRAAVSQDGRPDLWVAVDPLLGDPELASLSLDLRPEGGTVPLSGLESVMKFIQGFYAILSSLVPK